MATSDFPRHFEGSLDEFKQRQLLFALTRQLAEAQFLRGDRQRTERLWQEAAAENMDPERIIALLYGVEDLGDTAAMDELDRPFRDQQRQAALRARSPLSRLSHFTQRYPAAPHRQRTAARAMASAGRSH
ncbi:hypothetical protein [Cyanobium sp. CH-040]|uniref:hypothetical protein n=1 Tax=Cyanobium sp. CH-040 TaxID=2823708 RepID=UPI0020CBB683|nr:hypothetical protein [Cyanobium sp. CH-040]MCP9928597.1 hypothetical protein [Cyanobium sp. CH-040]